MAEETKGLILDKMNHINIKDTKKPDAMLQAIKKEKFRFQNLPQNAQAERITLVMSRKLGHDVEMPGARQWRIFSNIDDMDYSEDRHGNQNDCWVCDHQVYSLIFWDEMIALNELVEVDVQSQLEALNTFDEESNVPVIMGQFNNWKAQKLMTISEFCDKINKDKFDIFQLC